LQINEFPVLKADCIKFVAIFRNQMTLEMLAQLQILPTLVKHLQAESVVQLTYAADALWHFFSLKVSIYLSIYLFISPPTTRKAQDHILSFCKGRSYG
jgi:hypothetical protein